MNNILKSNFKTQLLFIFYSILLVISIYLVIAGTASMTSDVINNKISQFLETALIAASFTVSGIRRLHRILFLAGMSLLLIGLTGLTISAAGLYDLMKGSKFLKALRTLRSSIGLVLFLLPLWAYWAIFHELDQSVKFISWINEILAINFLRFYPWPFIVPATVGMILLVLSTVSAYKRERYELKMAEAARDREFMKRTMETQEAFSFSDSEADNRS